MTARRRSASASTATAIICDNPVYAVVDLERHLVDRHRSAVTPTASAKPAPARCGLQDAWKIVPAL